MGGGGGSPPSARCHSAAGVRREGPRRREREEEGAGSAPAPPAASGSRGGPPRNPGWLSGAGRRGLPWCGAEGRGAGFSCLRWEMGSAERGFPAAGRCGGSVGAGGAGRAPAGALRWRAWVGLVAGTPLCCEIPKLELYKPCLWIWLAQFLQLATPAFYSLRSVQANDAGLRKNPFPVRPWLAEGLRSAALAPGSAGRGAAEAREGPGAPRSRGRGA